MGHPMFSKFVRETLKEHRVKAEVLASKFQLQGGKVPDVGQVVEMPLSDARDREYMGHVRIIPGTEREIDTGVRLVDPPRPPYPSQW